MTFCLAPHSLDDQGCTVCTTHHTPCLTLLLFMKKTVSATLQDDQVEWITPILSSLLCEPSLDRGDLNKGLEGFSKCPVCSVFQNTIFGVTCRWLVPILCWKTFWLSTNTSILYSCSLSCWQHQHRHTYLQPPITLVIELLHIPLREVMLHKWVTVRRNYCPSRHERMCITRQ